MIFPRPNSLLPLLGPLLTVFSCYVQAWSQWQVDGFASLAAGFTLNEGRAADGSRAKFDTESGVYDSDLSFRPDSILGLQASTDLDNQFGLTMQVTAEGDRDFDVEVRWAFLSYEIDDRWKILLGRQRLPVFFYSDSLEVGYSYHWVRPPTELNLPADILDGIQVFRTFHTDEWDTTIQTYYGSSEGNSEDIGKFKFDDGYGLVVSSGNEWLMWRLTYSKSEFSVVRPAHSGLARFDPVDSIYSGAALRLSWLKWFLVGELGHNELDDPVSVNSTGGYLSLGYQVRQFTPHITLGRYRASLRNSADIEGTKIQDQSLTLGLRWDFHPSAAFKVEYQTRADKSDPRIRFSRGDIRNTDLFSVSLDLVF